MDQTSLGLNQQEAGDGSRVGGPTANIRGMCEGDRVRGRGDVAQAVVASDGCVTAAEDHAKRYFSRIVGAVATGIWQVW